ncbi:Lrp/AsnC family transcriptional regulator [Tropicibacter sp. R16_0]|uniref:Lrp/AsnC family transcriptional regulator n=1 Tax=Tropicibacter sp. R16_0 TaxID=2821102 RepID=UPI001ADA439A|nr:Lrp/AsnC family transcriptional regulator [Tropicibacter sp. R16_0]MBO9451555.1 Lrp/AsnC family transcriptional regulator [Tropicibacter sp. R16_0]
MEIDRTDQRILALLSKDARITNKELSHEVGLAPSSVHDRLKRLYEQGLIAGTYADVRLDKLGLSLKALLFIQMSEHKKTDLEQMLNEILKIPEVRAGWMISGRFDAVVEVLAADTSHLHRLVVQRFSSRAEISRIETSIVFESVTQHDLDKTLELTATGMRTT